jgi:hypothetical protein
MYALYQQLELSAGNQQRDGFRESEQHWLAQQSARRHQNKDGGSNLTLSLKALFGKKLDTHTGLDETCYCHPA